MTRTYFKTREAGGDLWYYFAVNEEFSPARKVITDLARRISGADYELEQVTEKEYLASFRTFTRYADFNKVIVGPEDKNRWLQVGCDNFKSLSFRTSREVIKYLKKKVAAREKFEDRLKAAEITAQGPVTDPSED
jgi:hypothetical protein